MEENTKEYLMLREEMIMRIREQENISKFVITTSVVIFGYALSDPTINPLIYLLAFAIIIPFALKELENKRAISYIGGYIIVVLEEKLSQIEWGRNYFKFRMGDYDKDKMLNRIAAFGNLDFFLLGCLSITLFIIKYIELNKAEFDLYNMSQYEYGIIILCFVLLITLLVLTFQYNNYDNSLKNYVVIWLEFEKKNNRISIQQYDKLRNELIDGGLNKKIKLKTKRQII